MLTECEAGYGTIALRAGGGDCDHPGGSDGIWQRRCVISGAETFLRLTDRVARILISSGSISGRTRSLTGLSPFASCSASSDFKYLDKFHALNLVLYCFSLDNIRMSKLARVGYSPCLEPMLFPHDAYNIFQGMVHIKLSYVHTLHLPVILARRWRELDFRTHWCGRLWDSNGLESAFMRRQIVSLIWYYAREIYSKFRIAGCYHVPSVMAGPKVLDPYFGRGCLRTTRSLLPSCLQTPEKSR